MKELKPFGDVPDKLAVQIKRSFVATRTYWQALHTAAEVSKKIINVSNLLEDCSHHIWICNASLATLVKHLRTLLSA